MTTYTFTCDCCEHEVKPRMLADDRVTFEGHAETCVGVARIPQLPEELLAQLRADRDAG